MLRKTYWTKPDVTKNMLRRLVLLLCLLPFSAQGAELPRVAVTPFHNASGKNMEVRGDDMTGWMAGELKKTKKWNVIRAEQLGPVLGNAKRNGDGFDAETEAAVRALPADYILYGRIEV